MKNIGYSFRHLCCFADGMACPCIRVPLLVDFNPSHRVLALLGLTFFVLLFSTWFVSAFIFHMFHTGQNIHLLTFFPLGLLLNLEFILHLHLHHFFHSIYSYFLSFSDSLIPFYTGLAHSSLFIRWLRKYLYCLVKLHFFRSTAVMSWKDFHLLLFLSFHDSSVRLVRVEWSCCLLWMGLKWKKAAEIFEKKEVVPWYDP